MIREDYILRLVKQLADSVRRIARLRGRGDHEEAMAEADRAWGELLDAPCELRDALDGKTLAGLLGHPKSMRAAASLLAEEGRVMAARGDPLAAASRFRRALDLRLEARARDPEVDDSAEVAELTALL